MTSQDDFPLDASKYELLHLIGCGSTSEVYTAICKTNNRELAIKLINLEAYPMEIDFLRKEVAFWSSSQHPQVVKYYNSFISKTTLYILMECMSGGSVSDILRYSFPNGFTDEHVIATILQAILNALNYIHSNKELHRDVKPGNALVSSDGRIKIGDFGVAASLLNNSSRYTVIGTPCYMAPEVLENTGYTEKADIWSVGITAIELAMGSSPYSHMKPLQIVQKVLHAPPPFIPPESDFSQEFKDLVRLCLNYDPMKRPTAQELLKSSFFNKAKDSTYIRDNVLVKLPPLEQRFPMLRQEMANHLMNNIQEISHSKTEWDFDILTGNDPKQNVQPNVQKLKNEEGDVHVKGRFNITVERPQQAGQNQSHASIPAFASTPLFETSQPLLPSGVPNHQAMTSESQYQLTNADANQQNNEDELDPEEEELQATVDQLTEKVNGLLNEGKEIKQQIKQLLTLLGKASKVKRG